MKKKIIGLCAILILASGCGKIPTLENGQEAIVSFENGEMISVDDFYTKIKDSYGLQTLITMVDKYVLEEEFADYIETAELQAESYIDTFIESYGGEDEFLADLQQQLGYQTIEAYQESLYISMMQSHAIEEYAKNQITDEEIEDYYNNDVIGDIEIAHILITPDVTDDSTDEETEAAEEAAREQIEDIISQLNEAKENGENIEEVFSELAKEYSEDEDTKDDGGNLGEINYGDFDSEYDELIDAAVNLNDGEYSTEVITTELGYHVIYKIQSLEKDSLEDLEDEIRSTLGTEYINNNNDAGINALQHYRREYGMEIQDDEINKQYSTYIQNLLLQLQSEESNSTTE